ncbi:MAG: polyamine aminopropyltransferase [Proteobacteria bacterium]|jgi:spermidine synthase|nr:polyamine aminopropyltransferase [Pseudomonadota bacterium]
MRALGRHILVEFIGCSPELMNDVAHIEQAMVTAAKTAGATVIQSTFHHFSPYGVSGVVVIQESHLAIHTWPEYGYAAVDLFTCGDSVDPWISFDYLKKSFQAQNQSAIEMYRGSQSMLKRVEFNVAAERDDMAQRLSESFQRNVWFTDKDEHQALSLRYTGEVLFNEVTPFQQVRVLETYSHGKMLAINNMVMATEKDEAHYHEMIVHPAMQLHGSAKKVLVIGGGDGGTIREVFKYRVDTVTMVEIDEAVVRAAKAHLPTMSKEFSNPKLELLFADGIEYVKNVKPGSFDVIIVDGSDPVGPAEGLFSEEFFRNCAAALTDQGILVSQGEGPMFHETAFVEMHSCLNKIFGPEKAHTMLFYATTYPTGMWSLHFATKSALHPVADLNMAQAEKFSQDKDLHYYNSEIHRAAFQLPNFVRKMLSQK